MSCSAPLLSRVHLHYFGPGTFAATTALLLSAAPAHAGLLAYEPFTNAVGAAIIGSSGGHGFSAAWQSNSSQGTATNTSAGLGYTDSFGHVLVTSGGAGFFQGLTSANSSMQPNRQFDFTRATNGEAATTWISLLIVRQGPTNGTVNNPYARGVNVTFDYPSSSGGANQRVGLGNSSGAATNTVGILSAGGNLRPSANPPQQFGGGFGPYPPITNFIVLRVDHIAGTPQQANDNAYLWANPNLAVEPALNTATTNVLGLFDYSIGLVRVFVGGQDSGNNRPYGECLLDEIRVGESYADVTPYVGAPPPASLRFTHAHSSGGNLVLTGSGGAAGGTYQLLANADVNTPATIWPAVATNAFDGSGNFSLTQAIQPGAKFFRLRTAAPAGPVGPSFLNQPVSLTVTQGQPAMFSAVADGTAPLSYQWYFNTNTLLTGQTATNLTLASAQLTNAGSYSVRVSNVGGNVTSTQAVLTVLAPPNITAQPQSQTVSVTNNASFSVTATGTPPLAYQWYFNTNTPLPHATNAAYSITGVTSNDAGAYSVTINNNYGATTSLVATLTVTPAPPADFSHVGFAANGITLTGGAAGPTVFVGSEAQLQAYSDVNPPYTIIITQSFNLTSMDTHIRNNKTVIGSNNVVLSGGGLYLYDATNVIIRNLTITGSPEDGIGLHFAEHVWIDHCTITDSDDGAIDITQQSDNITISWCHIYYSSPSLAHRLASLIASSDSDAGNYRVTYHHNWFGTNCQERLPSVRFGRAHIFNNYYHAPGNNYCVRTRKQAECLVENNFFSGVQNPWEQYITGAGDVQGKLFAANNSVPFLGLANGVTWTGSATNGDGTIRVMIPGTDSVFTPPYAYSLQPVGDVPALVTGNAGAGRGPFAP